MGITLNWSNNDQENKKDECQNVVENAANQLPYSKTKILAALSQSVLNLQKKIDLLNSNKDDNDAKLESYKQDTNEQIQGIKESLESIKNEIADNTEFESYKQENDNQINSIKEEIENIKELVNSIKNDNTLANEISNIKNELSSLRAKDLALETKIENVRTHVNAQLTEMQNKWVSGVKPSDPPKVPEAGTETPDGTTEGNVEGTTDVQPGSEKETKSETSSKSSIDDLINDLKLKA